MSITGNPDQLVLVKQLFDDACILAAREDQLSLTKSLILLDLSVEQLLNQLIRDFKHDFSAGRNDVKWQRLWDLAAQVMKENGSELLNYKELSSLHDVRNLAQHNASIPSQTEVRRYINPTRETMVRVFLDAYRNHFDHFTVWHLIHNQRLRSMLEDAEEALLKGQAEICIAGCNVVHELIISAIRTSTKLRRAQISLTGVFPPSSGRLQAHVPYGMREIAAQAQRAADQMNDAIRRGVSEFRKEILREMEFLENEIVTIGIGMPLMDTRRFQKVGNYVGVSIAISGDLRMRSHTPPEKRDERESGAQFMLNYLSRLIRLVDESYPGVLDGIEVKKRLKDQKIWKFVDADWEEPSSNG